MLVIDTTNILDLPNNSASDLIFVGICERAQIREGMFVDCIGLSRIVPMAICPGHLESKTILLALKSGKHDRLAGCRITIHKQGEQKELAFIQYNSLKLISSSDSLPEHKPKLDELSINDEGKTNTTLILPTDGTGYSPLPLPMPKCWIQSPGTYEIRLTVNNISTLLGTFKTGLIECPEITPESERALLSKPGATSALALEFACNACGDKFWTSRSLGDHNENFDFDGKKIPYLELSGNWKCSCGAQSIDLSHMRQTLINLFTLSINTASNKNLHTELVEHRYQALIDDFHSLINKSPDEEEVQKFIEKNPAIWAWLSPTKILHKPKILTDHVADFGILDANGILKLIEIEKPSTKLLTQKGGVSAQAQAALNQIRDWKDAIRNHPQACRKSMKLENDKIRAIRYIVVAGMKQDLSDAEKAKYASSFKYSIGEDLEFFSFDELETLVLAYHSALHTNL